MEKAKLSFRMVVDWNGGGAEFSVRPDGALSIVFSGGGGMYQQNIRDLDADSAVALGSLLALAHKAQGAK